MALLVVGISHKTAPVELREKLAFSVDDLENILSDTKGRSLPNEIAILSTCNRREIYANSEDRARERCSEFLCGHFGRNDLENFLYVREEKEMVNHLFKVSAGLDSLVFGENEILKQVKDAYQISHKLG